MDFKLDLKFIMVLSLKSRLIFLKIQIPNCKGQHVYLLRNKLNCQVLQAGFLQLTERKRKKKKEREKGKEEKKKERKGGKPSM